MTLIRLVEEGPINGWLREKSLGRTYQLFKEHDRGYRLDIYRKRIRVFTEMQSFKDDDAARYWAREQFITFLFAEQCLPRGGALIE